MALAAPYSFGLSHHAAFCPQPLQIQKRTRRATFRKRIFRKSTHHGHNDEYVCGPLDDIINEIKSNLWESPHAHSTEASLLGWAVPLDVQSTWTVTPLPLSRTPSSQPLTIRKNRESRSSASSSSVGDAMYFSRTSSRDDADYGGPVGAPVSTGIAPWPLFDAPTSYESAHASSTSDAVNGLNHSEAPDCASQSVEKPALPSKRRSSRLRLLTGLSRLRRTDTAETSGSGGDTSDLKSPVSPEAHHENWLEEELLPEPSVDAVEAYFRKNGRK